MSLIAELWRGEKEEARSSAVIRGNNLEQHTSWLGLRHGKGKLVTGRGVQAFLVRNLRIKRVSRDLSPELCYVTRGM